MSTNLSERLKLAMKGPPKVTGVSLSRACGVATASVSDWLSGKSKSMDASNLIAAAEHLKVRPKWLANGVGPMRPESSLDTGSKVAEADVTYLPPPSMDRLTAELVSLFSQLDASSKRDFLNQLRGFVAGRRPHSDGTAPAMAG